MSSFTVTAYIKAIDNASRKLQVIGSEADRLGSRFRNLGQMAMTAGGVIAGMFVFQAVQAFQNFVIEGVKGAAEEEQALLRLKTGIHLLGEDWNAVNERLLGYLTKLKESSTLSFKAVVNLAADMATKMGMSSDQIIARLGAIVDASAALAEPPETVLQAVLSAIEGSTRSLKQFGLDLETELEGIEDKGKRAALIFDALHEKFGGATQEQMTSYASKWKLMERRWAEGAETIGANLLPLIDVTSEFATKIAIGLSAWPGLIERIAKGVAGFLSQIGADYEKWSSSLYLTWVTFWNELWDVTERATVAFYDYLANWAVSIKAGWAKWVVLLGEDWKWLWDQMSGITQYAGGQLQGFIESIQQGISGALGGIINAFNEALRHAQWVWNTIQGLLGRGSVTPISPPPATPTGPEGTWYEGMQHGGIVTKPTLALLGEAGPEAVLPLGRHGFGMGVGTPIIVQFYVSDDDLTRQRAKDFSEWVARELRRLR